MRMSGWLAALAVIAIAPASVSAEAAKWDGDGVIEEGEDETAELARAAQNPVANMISLPFQNNTNFNWGPGAVEETQNVLNIQPVWPFAVTDDWNVVTRTILPIVSQPGRFPSEDRQSGLGDTTFTAFLSPSETGKVIWGAGPVVLIPTATDDRLGLDKWGLGPSLVFLGMPGNWVIGALVSNLWSVGGSGDQDVNVFFSQVFVNYNLSDGWYLVSAPIITANWEAGSGERWTVPVGGGVGRIFRIGKAPPMNVSLQGYYNAVRPSFVGSAGMRFQIQLMFPKRS